MRRRGTPMSGADRMDTTSGVLVDSVQSQANGLEECLLQAIRDNVVSIPHVVVDFRKAGLDGITEITSLEAPHRVYDAILRDSLSGWRALHERRGREASRQSQARERHGAAGNLSYSAAIWRLAFDRGGRWPGCQVQSVPRLGNRGH